MGTALEKGFRTVQIRQLVSPIAEYSESATILVDWFREKYFVFPKDDVISREIFLVGEFDFYKLRRAYRHVSKLGLVGKTLVDVGANIGTICVPAVSRSYFANALAIEANANVAKVLEANIRLNSLQDRISFVHAAAGRAGRGAAPFVVDHANFGASRISDVGPKALDVKVDTLDNLVTSIEDIGLVFIDVEGYEGEVLLGASKILAAKVPIALEFSPKLVIHHTSKEEFCSLLSGYSTFISLNDPFSKKYAISELGVVWDWFLNESGVEQTDLLFF